MWKSFSVWQSNINLSWQDQRPEEMMTHQALPADQHPASGITHLTSFYSFQLVVPSLYIDYRSSLTASPSVVVSIKRTRRLTILKKTWFFSFPILYKYVEKETFFCFHLSMGTWPSFFLFLSDSIPYRHEWTKWESASLLHSKTIHYHPAHQSDPVGVSSTVVVEPEYMDAT